MVRVGKKSLERKKKSLPVKPLGYYLHIIENSRDILFSLNPQTGRLEYMSPAVKAIAGFAPGEIIKMGTDGVSRRTHPDNRPAIDKFIADSKEKKLPKHCIYYVEIRFKHKKGHYIWVGINRNFVTDRRGNIKLVIGNARDITETKKLQQQLESALDNYKALYNNARVALYRTRISDGKMLECNEFMAKMLGYENREQCLAKHYSAKCYANPQRRIELMKLLKERGKVDNFELETWRVDNSVLWMRVSVQAYPEKGYCEGTIWDITASKILTPAENQVLEQIMFGKSSKEIAFQLKRSIRTIEDHRAHIMQKFGVRNLVELTQKTIEARP
jgi:PAS domain S-box-containing protein